MLKNMQGFADLLKSFFAKQNPLEKALPPINQKIEYKELNPINYNDNIIESFQKDILTFLFRLIFKDIKEILKDYNAFVNDISNSQQSLIKAIQEGKITYTRTGFKSNFEDGRFPISLTKTLKGYGAEFDKRTNLFIISSTKLPADIQQAINTSVIDNVYFANKLNEALTKAQLTTEFDKFFNVAIFETHYQNIVNDTIKQIKSNAVTIPIELNEQQALKIKQDYTENLKLTIKDFTDKEIVKLREIVQENTIEGYRPQVLADKITERFGVSKSKAEFLADQETRLLTTKFTELKFTENNITSKFKWGKSVSRKPDEFHKQYYDKEFDYLNPPIINEATGEKGLPGQRFNCKCRIIPIIEELK